MNTNGTIKAHQKISNTSGNLGVNLPANSDFGSYIAPLGDIDADGVPDILVTAERYNNKGAAFILKLYPNGTVKSILTIAPGTAGFNGQVDNVDYFGSSAVKIGDINNDGHFDLAIGAMLDDDGGAERGAIWILFLNSDFNVIGYQKISNIDGKFYGLLRNNDMFGASISSCGDFNNDGTNDIIVGSPSPNYKGRFFILFLLPNGQVKNFVEIGENDPVLSGVLDKNDRFSWDVRYINDFNSDGYPEVISAAYMDDDGGTDKGAFYILTLNRDMYSIESVSNKRAVVVYPQPFSSYFNISTNISINQKSAFEVYNSLGKKVFSKSFELEQGRSSQSINTSTWNNGIYFYKILIDNQLYTDIIKKND